MATELLDQDTVLHVTDVEESAALTSVLAEAGITLEELRELWRVRVPRGPHGLARSQGRWGRLISTSVPEGFPAF